MRAHSTCAALLLLSILIFWTPLRALAQLSLHDEVYTQVILIPLMSLALIILERKRIFKDSAARPLAGLPLIGLGACAYYLVRSPFPGSVPNDRLSLAALAVMAVWIGIFVLCYGIRSSVNASFALLLLFGMVPLPGALVTRILNALQQGSADVTYAMFRLAGIPVLRQEFGFALPGLEIQIAPQCSGIRSSCALFIAGLLAGHAFLRSLSRKTLLALCVLPVLVFKNAVRIVSISLLAMYVDRSFLYGRLHHDGGVLFAILGILLMVPVIIVLQKTETAGRVNREARVVQS